MIHKVLKKSRTLVNPFPYLIEQRDRKIAPEIIQGDPDQVYGVIKTSTWSERYTNLVLSWSEKLSDDELSEAIKSYESMAFAGLDEQDIARCWIRHEDKGRTEAHCVVANTHLSTGKRYVHYLDKIDRPLFKDWAEIENDRNGWATPDDPARMKYQTTPGKSLPEEKKQLYREVDSTICELIAEGAVDSREDVAKILRESGFIVKEGKYLSIKQDQADRAIRLKGIQYERGFTVGKVEEASQRAQEAWARGRERDRGAGAERRREREPDRELGADSPDRNSEEIREPSHSNDRTGSETNQYENRLRARAERAREKFSVTPKSKPDSRGRPPIHQPLADLPNPEKIDDELRTRIRSSQDPGHERTDRESQGVKKFEYAIGFLRIGIEGFKGAARAILKRGVRWPRGRARQREIHRAVGRAGDEVSRAAEDFGHLERGILAAIEADSGVSRSRSVGRSRRATELEQPGGFDIGI